ncbi:MAG: HlyD family efflux transporter periplasmic adaptor subunit [Dehalobacterium sp.]
MNNITYKLFGRCVPGGAFIIMIILSSLYLTACSRSSAEAGGFDPAEGLIAKGYVESEEVDLNTKIPGKIAEIYVEEGQPVQAGDLVAEIDSTQLQAKKGQVEAQVKMAQEAIELQKKVTDANIEQASGVFQAAQAQLNKAQEGARDQEIAQAKAYYEMMEKTNDRVKKLYDKGAISAQKKDEVETQLKVAKEQYSMAQEGAREQDVEAAQGLANQAAGALSAATASKLQVQLAEEKYQEALAGLAEVNSLIADTKIIAPKSGTIVELNCEKGELVSSGMPIATIADLKEINLLINVYETDLAQVYIGQKADVRFIGTGNHIFPGTVKRISSKPRFATEKATNNQEDDVLAYEVKVAVPDLGEVQIYPGMSAYVQFTREK